MKEALTSIEAHQRILRNFTLGYELWISFVTDAEKVPAKDVEWTAQYGTRLLSYPADLRDAALERTVPKQYQRPAP